MILIRDVLRLSRKSRFIHIVKVVAVYNRSTSVRMYSLDASDAYGEWTLFFKEQTIQKQ